MKPGALYSDCAVVRLKMTTPRDPAKEKGKGAAGKGSGDQHCPAADISLPDDGELGEELGGLVWEAFEEGLKGWVSEDVPKDNAKSDATLPHESPVAS